MNATQKMDRIVDEFESEHGMLDCECELDSDTADARPFLLIERRQGKPYWATTHSSPEAAAKYHESDGSGEGDTVELLVDVRDGTEYEVELVARVRRMS